MTQHPNISSKWWRLIEMTNKQNKHNQRKAWLIKRSPHYNKKKQDLIDHFILEMHIWHRSTEATLVGELVQWHLKVTDTKAQVSLTSGSRVGKRMHVGKIIWLSGRLRVASCDSTTPQAGNVPLCSRRYLKFNLATQSSPSCTPALS